MAASALSRIRAICLSLPEATERSFGGHTAPAFRVRDKLFVMTSEDGTSMTLKGDRGVQATLIAANPDRYFSPKYVGPKGWVGVQLDPPSRHRLGRARRAHHGELLPDRPEEAGGPGRGRRYRAGVRLISTESEACE